MCGIAGYINFDREKVSSFSQLKAMTDVIAHRGPDGEGFFIEKNIALGHRRLSIIDLECGSQPMFYDDKNYVLIFNGEIYNYIELRKELEKKGFSFITHSDTEVILAAYQAWGADCVQHFNGMWAFALWDKKNERLFCSRDRVGEKPFFYSVYENSFIFGSEIKTLFAYGVPKQINEEMLDAYLCFTYIPAPHTFFKNIFKLEPGHSLIIENKNIKKIQYWDVEFTEEKNSRRDEEKILCEFEEIFLDSVRIRMRSDVPFGAFLSGGLDSSSIVAAMSSLSDYPIKTCTIGFASKDYDERMLARIVADYFSTDHTERLVEPNDAEVMMTKLAWHYDEPFGDSSALPTFIVSKIARENVTMVLTGDGGDEILSGYTIHQGEKFSDLFLKIPSLVRKKILPDIVSIGNNLASGKLKKQFLRAQKVIVSSNLDFVDRIEAKQTGFTHRQRKILLQNKKNIQPARDFIEESIKKYSSSENFMKLNYWLTKVSLPDDMLCKVDRASMANSLETRVPFLDYRLIELMANVSMKVKMKGYTRKAVLRNTIGKRLPEELLRAPKRGFAVPLTEWMKNGTSGLVYTKARSIGATGVIDPIGIEKILTEVENNSQDSGNALWALAMISYSIS